MSTHNICFRGEIRKIFCRYPTYLGYGLYQDNKKKIFSFNFNSNNLSGALNCSKIKLFVSN